MGIQWLHVGQDVLIKREEIIGIFDLDTTTVSKLSRDFLKRAEQEGEAVTVSGELPKSFVVVQPQSPKKRQTQNVYISQLSTATLLKRADIGSNWRV